MLVRSMGRYALYASPANGPPFTAWGSGIRPSVAPCHVTCRSVRTSQQRIPNRSETPLRSKVGNNEGPTGVGEGGDCALRKTKGKFAGRREGGESDTVVAQRWRRPIAKCSGAILKNNTASRGAASSRGLQPQSSFRSCLFVPSFTVFA